MTNKEIIIDSIHKYQQIMNDNSEDGRNNQIIQLLNTFNKIDINDGPINTIETGASFNIKDGAMGLLFGIISQRTGGRMWMVDIDANKIEESKKLFEKYNIDCVNFVVQDSVHFLQKFNEKIDIIHLDSYDLDILDPFPSALHGWREFEAIKDKMYSKSIILIDDNYINGTWVNWHLVSNNDIIKTERIDIKYPCIGKGAHIYWWSIQENTDWELVSDLIVGENIKITCQKKIKYK